MKAGALKLIFIAGIAVIYWMTQRPSYELVDSISADYKAFHSSDQGYRLQLPASFVEPVEACPLRTSGLQLLTYFTPAAGRASDAFFIVGSFKERDDIWGFIRKNLQLLANNEINETKFMQEVRSSGESELRKINGYQVLISRPRNSHRFEQQVMFISNDTLIGFMLSAPRGYESSMTNIVNSLQPL